MSQNPTAAIAIVGIDIGKNSFHIVGLDHAGDALRPCRGQVEGGNPEGPSKLGNLQGKKRTHDRLRINIVWLRLRGTAAVNAIGNN